MILTLLEITRSMELALTTEVAICAVALELARRDQVTVTVVLADVTECAWVLVLALVTIVTDVAITICTHVAVAHRAPAVLMTLQSIVDVTWHAFVARLALIPVGACAAEVVILVGDAAQTGARVLTRLTRARIPQLTVLTVVAALTTTSVAAV